MLFKALSRLCFSVFLATCMLAIAGCGDAKQPVGPEMGALDQYLEENPDEREDDEAMMDSMEEGDEFADGEGE